MLGRASRNESGSAAAPERCVDDLRGERSSPVANVHAAELADAAGNMPSTKDTRIVRPYHPDASERDDPVAAREAVS